jgi:hypothetical protein
MGLRSTASCIKNVVEARTKTQILVDGEQMYPSASPKSLQVRVGPLDQPRAKLVQVGSWRNGATEVSPSVTVACRSRKLDLNAFSGIIVGVKIKHTRRSRGKLMVREKVARL